MHALTSAAAQQYTQLRAAVEQQFRAYETERIRKQQLEPAQAPDPGTSHAS